MKKITVSLTGGLGNQLFQLANALSISDSFEVDFESCIGKPRLNSEGDPELFSFLLPKTIRLLEKRRCSWLVRKACGYFLRSGILPKSYERAPLYSRLVQLVTSTLVSAHLGRWTLAQAGSNIGYSGLPRIDTNRFIIGYFQTYRSLQEMRVKEFFNTVKPKLGDLEVVSYKEIAEREIPLVVHLRLTDYESESEFGIPSIDYYEKAFEFMNLHVEFGRVWIFTDDEVKAQKLLPHNLTSDARWIPKVANSSAATLEVMRYGHNYIIGNSTFSWWGATLSYAESPLVIAPEPWFKSIYEPRDLIPTNWKRFPAW
jgi:hypothetical protein